MKAKAPFALTDHILLNPSDLNSDWSMHGGRLFSLMDLKAAIVARNHADCVCHTVAVSPFKYSQPINTCHELIIRAKITKSWNTSMEVKVEAFRKALGTQKELVTAIYFYFVAIKNGVPELVPPVLARTKKESEEYMRADERRKEVKHFIEKYIENLNPGKS